MLVTHPLGAPPVRHVSYDDPDFMSCPPPSGWNSLGSDVMSSDALNDRRAELPGALLPALKPSDTSWVDIVLSVR